MRRNLPTTLTCDVKRRVATNDAESRLGVRRVAVVDADIRRSWRRAAGLARRQKPEEEKLTARQLHPVDGRVLVGGDDRLSVAVPRDDGWRLSLGFAVQLRRLVTHNVLVLGMFDDKRVCDLSHVYIYTTARDQYKYTVSK